MRGKVYVTKIPKLHSFWQVAREGDSRVQHSFNVKVRKYSGRCEAEGLAFVPMIVHRC